MFYNIFSLIKLYICKNYKSEKMKKLALILVGLIIFSNSYSQKVVSENTKKKFSIGMDFFSDIWQNTPDNLELNTINRGFNVFGMYNYQFGRSNFSFAIGAAICSHNMYTNAFVGVEDNKTVFTPIVDSLDYKKSKLSVTYLDLPFEFRLKTIKKFRLAIGFKAGIIIDKHTKYKGNDPMGSDGDVVIKSDNVKYLEKYRYGPVFRIGYKWANFMAYYQLSDLFKPDQGPEMFPVSVGITLMPF